jgi:hypothetical protein
MAKAPKKMTRSEASEAGQWLAEIAKAQAVQSMVRWRNRCDKIDRNYTYDQSEEGKTSRYAMLWSNIETLAPAVYSKPPAAVVERRWNDKDPIGREGSEILERAINFQFDYNDFDSCFKKITQDYLLYGRAVPRLYYDPEMESPVDGCEDEGVPLDTVDVEGPQASQQLYNKAPPEQDLDDEDDGAPAESGPLPAPGGYGANQPPPELIKFEHVKIVFVNRDDFVHSKARTWEEVDWIAFRAYLSKSAWRKRFGDEEFPGADQGSGPREAGRSGAADESIKDKRAVWEIWDKVTGKVFWVSDGVDHFLSDKKHNQNDKDHGKEDPYLKLSGFFPCPKPAYGTLLNNSLEPVPDFVQYQDQCEEINILTRRIAALTEQLKLVGFYPGGPRGEGVPEIEAAIRPGFENRMIALKSMDVLSQGGQKGVVPIVFLPIEMVANIIKECVELRKQLIEDVYQIFGISDIMRGDGKASETATAQNIKAQYGSVRIKTRQNELARLCRDVVRMAGEIIATQFTQPTLAKMTNVKLPTREELQQQFQQQMVQFQLELRQYQQQQRIAAAQMGGALPGVGGPAGAPGPGAGGPPGPGAPPMGGPAGPGGPPGGPAPNQGPPQAPPPPQPPQPPPPPDQGGPVTWDDVLELYQDGVSRRFRLDIEADSTIVGDESQERQDRTNFVEALTKFIEAWGPVLQAQPVMLHLAEEALLFVVRSFRVGRQLENVIQETFEKLEELAGQPKSPPPPDPTEMAKIQGIQIKAQAEFQKAQLDAQAAQQKAQADLAAAQQKASADEAAHVMALKEHAVKHELESTRLLMQLQHDRERHGMELERGRLEEARQAREHEHKMAAAKQDHEHKQKLNSSMFANKKAEK